MYSRIVLARRNRSFLIAVDRESVGAAFAAPNCMSWRRRSAVPISRRRRSPVIARLSDTSAKSADQRDVCKRHGVNVVRHPASAALPRADGRGRMIGTDLIVIGNAAMAGHVRKFTGSVGSRLVHQSSRASSCTPAEC